MRIVDLETGKSYVEKRRVRFNEPGQPRELTFSCYRNYAFLGRDRTREWFCEALDEARREFAYQLGARPDSCPKRFRGTVRPATRRAGCR
jgi:hypothetical protein